MKALVTGAAGFIGSHLVRGLLREGHIVRGIDDLSTGHLWRLTEVMGEIEWIEASICDAAACARAVEGVEIVFHQAALPSVGRSLADPPGSDLVNVNGTVTLLQACRQAGVRRLVYAASSSAYGDAPTLPKVETICPNPLSPYAVSKLAGELYCIAFSRLGYVETVCLRYFNVFGPMQDPAAQYAAVIPAFVCALLDDRPIPMNGDGSQSRDFTYVDNAVQANLRAMTADGASGEVMNVGTGERRDLNALVRILAGIIGVEPKVEHRPARPGDVQHSLADITKARRILDYQPSVGFEEGLRRTVNWFRARRQHGG